jgi:pimeloyl-ACP methyl ester carboxylesterase
MIPFTKFSEKGEHLHFAHANGYPSGCYGSFLKPFFKDYRVIGMHARPLWNIKHASAFSNWKKFADDYINFCEEQALYDIVGMGHSMGAISSLIAAHNKQGLFKKLVLIDPVITPPHFEKVSLLPFFLAKRFNPMVKIALRRKNHWDSKEEAIEYFKSKKTYRRFDEDSFGDFIEHGLCQKDGKWRLTYPRELEAKVYSSVPSVWHILKNPPCPLIILRAEYSNVINDQVWRQIKSVTPNSTFIEVSRVGHMMPLEKSRQLAQLILPLLRA